MAKRVATAKAIEPEVTTTLSTLASSVGGQMEGLDFKFKNPDGIVEKVGRKVLASGGAVTPEQAAAGISDVLRYTMTFPASGHGARIATVASAMDKAGFDLDPLENHWVPGDAYNGINTTFTHRGSGMKVELQFHTPESWDIKTNVNHKPYEELRSGHDLTPARREALHHRMTRAADTVPWPDGVDNLGVVVHRPFDE